MIAHVLFALALSSEVEPNPPQWPDSILFNPTQGEIDNTFERLGQELKSHFLDERRAFFFHPGQHDVDLKLGYYTSALGIGERRDDVNIKNLYVGDGSHESGALNNFWRGAENFVVTAPRGLGGPPETREHTATFAVSQAAPMRNIKVNGNLWFFELEEVPPPKYWEGVNQDWEGGMASGGYLANVEAIGPVKFGSQQQFFLRNANLPAGSEAAVFNTVMVGCEGDLTATTDPTLKINLPEVPQIAEKPYIFVRGSEYFIRVPEVRSNTKGVAETDGKDIPFQNVYVAKVTDTADEIQSKINSAHIKGVFFAPGNYELSKTLTVEKDDFVILGHQAFLQQPEDGTSTLRISGSGNRIAGLTFEARSPKDAQFEEPMFHVVGSGTEGNPTVLSDIFSRIGRFYNKLNTPMPAVPQVKADVSLQVDQNFTIVDHIWLWKADHEAYRDDRSEPRLHWYQSKRDDNISRHGLVVKGNNVKVYGLFAEHHDREDVIWEGRDGVCMFFQNEWAYQQNQNDVNEKQAAYLVTKNAVGHRAHGLGSYTNFTKHQSQAVVGLKFEIDDELQLNGGLVWPLDGVDGSGIRYVAQFGYRQVQEAKLKHGEDDETKPTYLFPKWEKIEEREEEEADDWTLVHHRKV